MVDLAPQPSELPAPHVSLVLIRTGAEAVIRALGRKRGERFLLAWLELLAREGSAALVMPLRPSTDWQSQVQAGREAAAWLREAAPTLIAVIPPE